ncbi:MAG: MFS transporter [Spirochaetales bacterium]|nr:MFS transporter [Spirochaetales bacterium]
MEKQTLRRYFQFFLIVLAAGAIYPIVYLRTNFQETILEVFGMTLQQLNTIYSVLGIVFVVGYLPSGLLSDKFSAKKLLAISLAGTALGGFWFAQVPQFRSVVLIYCIWGTFSVFTFWSSHMKLVKLLARKEEEGRFFGILDGGRGVVEAVLASVAVFIFSRILGSSLDLADKHSAIVAVIYMYSIVLAATALLVWFFVEEDDAGEAEGDESARFRLSDLPKVLENKNLYLHGAIIFLGYAVFWTVYYVGGFLQTNVGAAPVTVGTVTVAVLWMRPVGGFVGGYFADKVGKTNTIIVSLAGAGIFLALIAILPVSAAQGVFFAAVIILAIFLYAIRGTYWSILGDDGFDNALLGSAIGAISLIGYLPDIILPQFNSVLFNTFGGNGGYNAYFLSSAGFAVVGIVCAVLYGRMHKKGRVAA